MLKIVLSLAFAPTDPDDLTLQWVNLLVIDELFGVNSRTVDDYVVTTSHLHTTSHTNH